MLTTTRVFQVWPLQSPGRGLLLVLGLWACEARYKQSPTFCDDWCRATSVGACDSAPDECVRRCELTRSSAGCFSLQQALLSCYQQAGTDAFVCVGEGQGLGELRVQPEVCRAERDGLFECEAPGIQNCLGICRSRQGEWLARFADAGAPADPQVLPPRVIDLNAPGPLCSALAQPCESACWSLFSVAQLQAGAGLGEVGAAAECAQAAVLQCLEPGRSPGSAAICP
jgi:hypothetical protein